VCACPIESENSLGECVRVCILNAACMFHSLFAFLLFTFLYVFCLLLAFFFFFVIYFSCAIVCALLSLFFWSAATSTAAICDPRTDRCSYSAVCSAVAKKKRAKFLRMRRRQRSRKRPKIAFFSGVLHICVVLRCLFFSVVVLYIFCTFL